MRGGEVNNPFDEDYFLRGKTSGKSLYEDYRWLPDLTIPMAQAIVDHVGICKGQTVLDFGCARGYLVKALRHLGYAAHGVDCSEWAVDNCDSDVKRYVHLGGIEASPLRRPRWIIAKDVLEHVNDLALVIRDMQKAAAEGIFVVVPLSLNINTPYVVPEYESDVTHLWRWSLGDWADSFMLPGWSVEASYRVRGVKDNYANYAMGNGFITARRI